MLNLPFPFMPPLPAKLPTPVPEVIDFFKRQQKTVLTLVGYSGAGYHRPEKVRDQVVAVFGQYDPSRTIVNIGVTEDGIGQAYGWAKSSGFTTSGVVSSAVLQCDAKLSPGCDYPFIVEDATWGGYAGGQLSPVSETMVSVSDFMLGVGGGDIARDELLEMEKRGKPLLFIEADMDHLRALTKAWCNGLLTPKSADYRGSAHTRFGRA